MDHTDGALAHLAQRDVSFAAVSRAPLSKIEAFKKRLDWRFVGSRRMGPSSTTTTMLPLPRRKSPKARLSITSTLWNFPARKRLESASSIRTRAATSSTPIPPTLAGLKALSTPITILTWCRRDATKMICIFPWLGYATTTVTRTAGWRMPKKPYWPAEAAPAR